MYLVVIWLVCLIQINCFQGSFSENIRIPNNGETCNVVNLNIGGETGENNGQLRTKGDPGFPGKKGRPGVEGQPGRKGEKGQRGLKGEEATPLNSNEIKMDLLKILAATSCQDLKENHGVSVSGHYLVKKENSSNPEYVYCDFEIRQGVSTCAEIGKKFLVSKSGYYLAQTGDSAEPTYLYCKTFTEKNKPRDCRNVSRDDAKISNTTGGVFDIFLQDADEQSVEVYCDLTTDGGGWTVFQRRMDGSVNFYRNWAEYVRGFGDKDKEMWLGLETIHQMTKNGRYELRIDLSDWEGNSVHAKYSTFAVASADDNYRLTINGYSGNAQDSMLYQNKMQFTTKDADNDLFSLQCAEHHYGAWWYNDCAYSNLNGRYFKGGVHSGSSHGIFWVGWKNTWNYSMKFTEMKFRKVN